MKEVNVVAAIIIKKNLGQIEVLATERGHGEFKGGWEFPGGKIEENESPKNALSREIKEELGAEVEIKELFCKVRHQYEKFMLNMDCYLVALKTSIELKEHSDARWLNSNNIMSVEWLPADIPVAKKLQDYIKNKESL